VSLTGDQIRFLRPLKGAPSLILMTLVLVGHSLQQHELERATGYTDKPISKGLALLESLGLVQNNGRQYGWSLASGARQLSLFPDSVLALLEDQGMVTVDGVEVGKFPTCDTNEVGKIPTSNAPTPHGRARGFSSSLSSSSLYKPTLTGDIEEERKTPQSRNNSDFDDEVVDNSVDKWLFEAGIGRNSPKWREIVAKNYSPDYVKAHVLQFLSQDDARVTVGTLIVRLLDGDVMPKMRCEDCYGVLVDSYCQVCRLGS